MNTPSYTVHIKIVDEANQSRYMTHATIDLKDFDGSDVMEAESRFHQVILHFKDSPERKSYESQVEHLAEDVGE